MVERDSRTAEEAGSTPLNYFKHALADVQTLSIGPGTRIWQFCVILAGARIGANVNVCSHCFIENRVVIGDNVTVKNGVHIYDGIHIEDDVFIGPGVVFTNDKMPRSKRHPDNYPQTVINKGASIGGGAVILPGIRVGEHAMIGAGAVVSRDVPAHALVYGDAARVRAMLKP